jgi:ABC-2 type transport system permease protein
VNVQRFQAFLWLRWRLRVNQLKRGGIANAIILGILAAAAILVVLLMFFAFLVVGLLAMSDAPNVAVLYVWDGLIVVFLFWWGIGIITDLQRSEALSLDKFLHLPVSLSGAFFINYLSSLVSLTMIVFVPAMAGFSLGLLFSKGPAMLLVFPLAAAFLYLVTALTYQFQGWLASLMANKRRQRTIVVLVTMSMIVLCNLPNLINVFQPWKRNGPDELLVRYNEETEKLKSALAAGEISAADFSQRQKEANAIFKAETEERGRQKLASFESWVRLINLVLPPGWLALGAMELAEGNPLPALLGTLGLGLIGTVSLWRAYRTTVRYYTGQFNARRTTPVPAAPPAAIDRSPAYFLEKEVPWVSEAAAAIALASFRSLLRAPEAKMLLLSPIILIVLFGSMFLSGTMTPSENVRPLLPFSASALVLFSLVSLVGNQFGFDRSGFRVYVLCPAQRRDILLGKNLAIAPLALALSALMTVLLQALYPLQWDHLLAVPFQWVAMFLLFCLMANWLSILAPMAIAAGSLRASNAKGLPLLLNIAFVFLFPLAIAPTLLPLGIEFLLHGRGFLEGFPISLLLTVLELAGIVLLYRLVLTWQGNLLQRREQRILELVAAKAE